MRLLELELEGKSACGVMDMETWMECSRLQAQVRVMLLLLLLWWVWWRGIVCVEVKGCGDGEKMVMGS